MSIAESSNLTRLLRLLTDVASAAETQQLRASMREDEILRQQHDRLLQIMTRPFSLGNSLLHLEHVDAEDVAAFIDGTLSRSEEAAFEKQCWNSDSLLGEVAAGWRLEHQPQAADGIPLSPAHNLADDVATSKIARAAASDNGQVFPTLAEVPEIDTVTPQRKNVGRTPYRTYMGGLLGLAAAAILAAAIFGVWNWIAPAEKVPGGTDPERIVKQEKERGGALQRSVVQDDGDAELRKENQPRTPGFDPEMRRPEIVPPSDGLVDGPDVKRPLPEPEPGKPRSPGIPLPPSQPQVNLAKWLDWSDVQGIAATKDAAAEKWRGIKVPKSYKLDDTVNWIHVATLSASQLKGEDERGAKWTADANTSFRISQRGDSSDGVVVCDLESGRLAFENLAIGRKLYLKLDQQEYQFVVDEADTTMVAQRLGREMVFGVFRGSVTFDGNAISRRSWRTVDGSGKVENFRPERLKAWYNQSVESAAPATLRNKLNNAQDFLAQVIDVSRNGTPLEQVIGTQAILQVRAADGQPPSDAELRKMMGSPQEFIRASLVKWIADQCLENPRFGMMMVQRVARLQSVAPSPAKSFQDWFAASGRGRQFDSALLNQLLGSLTVQSKPIVRQAAKFFLESYLGESIPYDPVKPGGSINRVITEVRRMVTEKQRRSLR